MIYLMLTLGGLSFGSFINALVWRLRHKRDWVRERSECVHCHHPLAAKDLIPVISWVMLRGKCRYCHKKIDDSPIVELTTAAVFVLSYLWWPFGFASGWLIAGFGWWLICLVLLVALLVYDLRWMLLPDKLTFALLPVAALFAVSVYIIGEKGNILHPLAGLVVLSGFFWVLFQVSKGKWIGGGDVKLGLSLGLLAGSAPKALLVLFISSVLGSLVSLPLLFSKRLKANSQIAYGPFLIMAVILVVLFGSEALDFLERQLLFT